MSYRIEELISHKGRVKIWRSIFGMASFSRNKAVAEASTIQRIAWTGGLWRKIRIRRNRKPQPPKGGDTK